MRNYKTYTTRDFADKRQELALRQIDNECDRCRLAIEKRATYRVLDAVIQNELTENERNAVTQHWFKRKKYSDIAAEKGVSAQSVRISVQRAEKKIYKAMKYVVLFDELTSGSDCTPPDIQFKIIKADGKELVS